MNRIYCIAAHHISHTHTTWHHITPHNRFHRITYLTTSHVTSHHMTTHRIVHHITHHMTSRITCDIADTPYHIITSHHYITSLHHITPLHHIISHRVEWHSTPHDMTWHYIIYRTAAHTIPYYMSIYTSYCIIRHCLGSHFLQVHHHTALYVRSALLYRYITTVQSTPWPCITLLPQVRHHTLRHCRSSNFFLQMRHWTAFYITATDHIISTRTSPYFTLLHCAGSHFFYKQITN